MAANQARARRTLYVTGFNPKTTSKRLLAELFTQGAPVSDVTLIDSHAYVLFQHEESVPYCLALFDGVELHGEKLRISPRVKRKDAFSYLKYLMTVRQTLRDAYLKIPPPNLPPKQMPIKKSPQKSQQHQTNRNFQKSKFNKPRTGRRIKQRR